VLRHQIPKGKEEVIKRIRIGARSGLIVAYSIWRKEHSRN